ncbi:MAG: hypothetical protein GC190_20045 [Alphaproteobacteria bacterium]|nr:hypothetical protein [Alphaproteobacteria bacterium]
MKPADSTYLKGYRTDDGPFVVKFQPDKPPFDMVALNDEDFDWGPGPVSFGHKVLAEMLLTLAHGRIPHRVDRDEFAARVVTELNRYRWFLSLEDIRELHAGMFKESDPRIRHVKGSRSHDGSTVVRFLRNEAGRQEERMDDVDYDWGPKITEGHLNLADMLLFVAYGKHPHILDRDDFVQWVVTALPMDEWTLTPEEIRKWRDKVRFDVF